MKKVILLLFFSILYLQTVAQIFGTPLSYKNNIICEQFVDIAQIKKVKIEDVRHRFMWRNGFYKFDSLYGCPHNIQRVYTSDCNTKPSKILVFLTDTLDYPFYQKYPNIGKVIFTGTHLPLSIHKYKQLEVLNIVAINSYNADIDKRGLFKLKKIVTNIGRDTIGGTIKGVKHLKNELPDFIYNCYQLESLNITVDSYTNINKNINNLSKLKELTVYSNKISKAIDTLPIDLELLKKLKSIGGNLSAGVLKQLQASSVSNLRYDNDILLNNSERLNLITSIKSIEILTIDEYYEPNIFSNTKNSNVYQINKFSQEDIEKFKKMPNLKKIILGTQAFDTENFTLAEDVFILFRNTLPNIEIVKKCFRDNKGNPQPCICEENQTY